MAPRFKIQEVAPNAYKAMLELEKNIQETEIDSSLKELIKIRASQINGCAYCLAIHTKDARNAGETEQRLYALSAWWESSLFNEHEKAALAMTDEITKISKRGLTEKTYKNALAYFNLYDLASIIMQIVTINSWNRIAISTHLK